MALFAEFTGTFKNIFRRQKLSPAVREKASFSRSHDLLSPGSGSPKIVEDKAPSAGEGRSASPRNNCGRTELRYSARVPVHFSLDNEHSGFGYSTNLSTSGILLETDSPPPTGTDLALVILLRGAIPTLRCRGQVVWQQENDGAGASQNHVEIGVQFLDLDPEQKKVVRSFIEQEGLRPRF